MVDAAWGYPVACEAFTACRGEIPKYLLETLLIYGMTFVAQGGSTILGRLRLAQALLLDLLTDSGEEELLEGVARTAVGGRRGFR